MIASQNPFEPIPDELKQLPRFVCWKFEKRGDDKPTKLPCSAYSSTVNAHDPANHLTFERACEAAATNAKLAGIGFVFTGDGLLGIDFDYCLDESGNPLPWAAGLLLQLSALTYGEISPSGLGVKFFARGKLAEGSAKRLDYLDGDKLPGTAHIEQYEAGRFFTITGRRYGTVTTIGDVQTVLDELQRRCRKPQVTVVPQPIRVTAPRDDYDTAKLAERASKYLGKMPPSISGQGGHDALLLAAGNLVNGFGLEAETALHLLRAEFNPRCEPPWSERELQHKISEVVKIGPPQGKPQFWLRDAERDEYRADDFAFADSDGEDAVSLDDPEPSEESAEGLGASQTKPSPRRFGNVKGGNKPLTIPEAAAVLRSITGGPPYRVGSALFVPRQRGVDWLASAAALMGWAATNTGPMRWKRGGSFFTKEEFFCEQCRTAPDFDGVEDLPHVPELPRHFYTWKQTAGGDGRAMQALLDRFSPATDIDRDLILSLFATVVWGGPGGSRPAYVVTSDTGRGAGKSSLAKILGIIGGGLMDFSQADSGEAIKSRLLSPDGQAIRVALLDNVKSHRFSWAELEALVTAATISGKRLYVGEARRPNTLVWVLTLNGASLSTDLSQRCVIIKLAKPSRSATWEDDVIRFATDNREAILGDLVAFLKTPAAPLARYSRWATWEAAVLARLPEPSEAQAIIAERQAAADVEAEEMATVEEHFADRLARLGYDPATEAVHIPNQTAATWWREATGDPKSPTAVTRIIKQLYDEGSLKRLMVNPSRARGRGTLWQPTGPITGTNYDLGERMQSYANYPNQNS